MRDSIVLKFFFISFGHLTFALSYHTEKTVWLIA